MITPKKFLLVCMAVGLLLQPFLSIARESSNETDPSKVKNIFTLRAERQFVGARVEIWNDGDLISSQTLERRKVLIDFTDVKNGTYTIKLVKSNRVEEYHYKKI